MGIGAMRKLLDGTTLTLIATETTRACLLTTCDWHYFGTAHERVPSPKACTPPQN